MDFNNEIKSMVPDALGADVPFEERIEKLNSDINRHHNIVIICGAGLSTASGIPDFRSQGGLYNQDISWLSARSPEDALSSSFFNHNTKEFYRFYREFMDIRSYEPNEAHKKMAELEKANRLSAIITQNIDGLNQKAGNTKVLEMHGTEYSAYCIKCGKKFDIDYIFDYDGPIARCDSERCTGKQNRYVKPDVVLYGESLPYINVNDVNGEPVSTPIVNVAMNAIQKADMMIVCGTSLQVMPVAGLVNYFVGETIVTINREPISQDRYSDVIFREDIVDVFSKVNISKYE